MDTSRFVSLGRTLSVSVLFLSVDLSTAAEPVSISTLATTPSASANSDSTLPVLSDDGNFVVFTSAADNLVTNDNNGLLLDVFLRNLTNGVTRLISVTPEGTASGNGISFSGGISSNNQFVVFESRAGNLVSNDVNNASDIFVRDVVNETTTLVSVNRFGTGSGNRNSSNPVMTPDGRFVAFESAASDLVLNDTNLVSDVFFRDLQAGTTTLISVRSNGVFSANGPSTFPAISDDGRIVVFKSLAMNVAPGISNTTNGVYFRDLNSGVTRMVNLPRTASVSPTVAVRVDAHSMALSADGQFLALLTGASNSNAVPDGIYYCDLVNNISARVATNFNTASMIGRASLQGPSMSADGQWVAFEARTNNSSLALLYLWNASGGALDLISPAGNAPLISADGSKVAYSGLLQVFAWDRATGSSALVSVDRDGNPVNDAEFPAVSISGDGRHVAFQSRHGNLVANDDNLAYDVFVRDPDAGTTTLVSARAPTLPSLTGFGASSIAANSVSADGRYVVFTTDAAGLVTNDTNDLADVFVRDLTTGSNILVSVNASGSGTGNGISREPVISENGRFVAFVSLASDLVNNDTNALDDIFLRDLQTGGTTLVSVNRDHTASGTGTSSRPSIGADGGRVAFQSRAFDLVPGDANGQPDVFVFDSATQTNQLVSSGSGGSASANGPSEAPVISEDGKRVVFQSRASNLPQSPGSTANYQFYLRDLDAGETLLVSRGSSLVVTGPTPGAMALSPDGNWVAFANGVASPLYVCDLRTGTNTTNTLVGTNATSPSLSADGRWLTFQQRTNTAASAQVWLMDTQSGSRQLISVNGTGTGGGNGASTSPAVSGDGRWVAFKSRADDLVGNDTNTWSDIFVRDRVVGITYLVSVNRAGNGGGNQLSSAPVMAPDGRTVLFQSFAADLAERDRNINRDIFLVRLGVGDSDGDGLADDWEVTYFSNLSRDGSGDFDDDGLSDFAEYRAGTDPINDVSVLRVISIAALGAGETTVIWTATSGKAYRVQYKDDLNDSWADLSVTVTVNGGQGSAVDSEVIAENTRFYRVVVLP
ncbi:MAG TPA: hypothetical protein VJW76_08480 [Verrucomicrobiae bacterium]|nr:hypothetical protein [Verrucomicrobiae bacterium]